MEIYKDSEQQLGQNVFIAAGAHVSGDVRIGQDSSIFYNSVARGDVNSIVIGKGTNVQDNCTLHVSDKFKLRIGDGVTVGHNVVLHGCTVEDNVLVGIGAVVLDGVVIGRDSVVAAGSLVTPGKEFPPGSMIMGSPARAVRQLSEDEKEKNMRMARKYVKTKNHHASLASKEIAG